jgi:hypothetical protein
MYNADEMHTFLMLCPSLKPSPDDADMEVASTYT